MHYGTPELDDIMPVHSPRLYTSDGLCEQCPRCEEIAPHPAYRDEGGVTLLWPWYDRHRQACPVGLQVAADIRLLDESNLAVLNPSVQGYRLAARSEIDAALRRLDNQATSIAALPRFLETVCKTLRAS